MINKTFLINILSTNYLKEKVCTKKIKTDATVYGAIINYSKFCKPSATVSERVYCIINNLSSKHLCEFCNKKETQYLNFKKGYRKYCSSLCAQSSEETRNKTKNTNLKQYGVENPSQRIDVKKKKTNTFMKHYGVPHIFSDNKLKEQYMLAKHGIKHSSYSKETIERRQETCLQRYGKRLPFSDQSFSLESQKFFNELYSRLPTNIQEHCHFATLNEEFAKNDKKNMKGYYYDFVISNLKYCIEFNGDFWHMNPKKYSSSDINNVTKRSAKETWKLDSEKTKFLEKMGYKISVVWYNEYKKNPDLHIDKCVNEIKDLAVL